MYVYMSVHQRMHKQIPSWCLQAASHVRLSGHAECQGASLNPNVGALIIRTGLGGPLYNNDNKEPPKTVLVII